MESSNLQQENFSSQDMRPLKTNQNVELWKTSPVDEFVKPHTKQRLRVHFILWGRKIVRIRSSGSFLSDFLVCFLGIWEAKPKSPTNTSAGTCATEEEQQQQTYQSDQDNDYEASTPEKKTGYNSAVLKEGEMIFPREEHIYWLFNTKCTALRTFVQVLFVQTNPVTFSNLYVYVYACNPINEKRDW